MYIDKQIYNIPKVTHYRISDGRVWSIADAKFIENIPDDAVILECLDKNGDTGLNGLLYCLDFYGYPKGKLKSDSEYASEAREKRNQLIAETDYLVMPDYPLPEDRRQAVLAYRQALRDVPEQAGFPRQIDWPVKP